jgi:4-amino-4-deoxy-L-arabinose transferase-like glycosyltransferase
MALEIFDKKISNIFYNPYVYIGIIMVISLVIRLNYFPNVPLTLDSLDYFFYASDITINQKLPENYTPANNGWPIFLSWFFSIANFNDVISYMQLQRIISIVISVLTIIPIFFLCKKYFGDNLSLLGSTIFAFEPRLIQNSLFGITDAMYIFLIALTLVSFLGSKKTIYLSFIFASFATLVRSEGIVLLLLISIFFFIKYKNQKKEFPKFIIAIGIMILILVPIMIFKTDVSGNDIIFSRAVTAVSVFDEYMYEGNEYGGNPLFTGIENFLKYFIWNLIPIFIFFVPLGIYYLFKKIDFSKIFIMIGIIFFSIPAFWAYSLPLQETRYLYFMYPFLILISLYTLKRISMKKYSNVIFSFIILGILFSSVIFLELKINNDQENEIYLISKEIAENIKVINSFPPESKFLEITSYPEKWEEFSIFFKEDRQQNLSIRNSINNIKLINSEKFQSLQEMIENSSPKLSHVLTDQTFNENNFLYDVYHNTNNFPFLIKEYDSKNDGHNYHVKLFRIDYEKFNEFSNKN